MRPKSIESIRVAIVLIVIGGVLFAIREAASMLEHVARLRRPGPYQLQAAIAACHAEAPSWEATDWEQIFLLYGRLVTFWPTSVVRLNNPGLCRQCLQDRPSLVRR